MRMHTPAVPRSPQRTLSFVLTGKTAVAIPTVSPLAAIEMKPIEFCRRYWTHGEVFHVRTAIFTEVPSCLLSMIRQDFLHGSEDKSRNSVTRITN